ncbi:hypothetical protein ACS0TY_016229 [Phlomoides rotata]
MVSSQIPPFRRKDGRCKPFEGMVLLPECSPDDVSSDQLELDFSDVFGPLPIQPSKELINGTDEEVNGLAYDDPEVIYKRTHSLVGPSACVSQSLKLSGLTIHENEDSMELLDSVINETSKKDQDISSDESVVEVCDNMVKTHTVGLDDFELLKVVGQGAFAKVYQVRKRGTSEIYAMKVMRKDKIMKNAEYIIAERDILMKIDHPFIVQLRYSFQTKYRLYLVLDFVNGGHLFFQLYHQGLFREDLARIYTAEIVSSVSHLHANGIMHRDLKPENVLLDADGHAKLTDFGLAKEWEENARSTSICGTAEYMSPEIILGNGHDKAADWWSVGILLFEMLTGKPPFIGGNREKIQRKIVKDKLKLPAYLTPEAHSLLKGLLQKEPDRRLGSGAKGSDEIKNHKWFKLINWKKLEAREIEPSFRPEVAGNHCIANFDKRYTDMTLADSPVSSPKDGANPFLGFTYVAPGSTFLNRSSPLS